jgi:hypothetical protein
MPPTSSTQFIFDAIQSQKVPKACAERPADYTQLDGEGERGHSTPVRHEICALRSVSLASAKLTGEAGWQSAERFAEQYWGILLFVDVCRANLHGSSMPPTARAAVGGACCHVLNRENARAEVFHKEGGEGKGVGKRYANAKSTLRFLTGAARNSGQTHFPYAPAAGLHRCQSPLLFL